MEQFKDTHDRQASPTEEQRDRTANPTTLIELVLRRLAEISERGVAKDPAKPGTAEHGGADIER